MFILCVSLRDIWINRSGKAQLSYKCNFNLLEVVGRAIETQFQVGENLNKIT